MTGWAVTPALYPALFGSDLVSLRTGGPGFKGFAEDEEVTKISKAVK